MKIKYIAGQNIGYCVFIQDEHSISVGKDTKRQAKFKCQCGKEFIAIIQEVKQCNTTSCGCRIIQNKKRCNPEIYVNGKIRPEYYSWCAMRRRCYDRTTNDYKNYGGRGIIVCDRWNKSFLNFLNDVGTKPSPKHSVDRFPDNNGNYELSNFRWATKKEQNNNTRKNRIIEYNGESLSLTDWSEKSGVPITTIFNRLATGLSIQQAIVKNKYNRGERIKNAHHLI